MHCSSNMEKVTFVLFCVILMLNVDCSESKVRKKFGCIRPIEPIYGGFKFNKKLRSLEIVCEEGFELVGTSKDWYCVREKWEDDLFMVPTRKLDFHDNCTTPFASSKECPPLQAPRNGILITSSRAAGGKAIFRCNEGYIIDGSEERICYPGNIWGGEQPVCRRMKTVGDMASLIQDEMISKLSSATATSEDGVQSKLAVGKSGLDIIFALDVSSSIGDKSLETAKDFIKLLVKTFGVSPHADGGKNGTRVAFITFASKANTTFNLNDPRVRSPEKVFEKIDSIKNTGGGTNFGRLYAKIMSISHLVIEVDTDRKDHATRAIFILTDAEATSKSNKRQINWDSLKHEKGFEIFTVGVGHTNKFKLSSIASKPYNKHVFMINEMADLGRIAEIISEKNLDHGQCGISGNTEIPEDSGTVKKDAWPWIGWVNVYDKASPKACGGYLVCQRYFATTATCVTMMTDDGNITAVDKTKILITLGDHQLYRPDPDEVQVRVSDLHIHPSYTGEANEYGVKEYDIALLDFGQDTTRQPVFNKHIRPICMATNVQSNVYAFSKDRRLHLQQNWQDTRKRGFVTGWGHKIERSIDLPAGILTQSKRTVQMNRRCKMRFPNLDTKKFFCVGNVRESDSCKNSDVGGPYMDEMNENKQYTVLGMALDIKDCSKFQRFSIFLNTLKNDIVKWLGRFLSDCNRVEEIIPTTEPPVAMTTTAARNRRTN